PGEYRLEGSARPPEPPRLTPLAGPLRPAPFRSPQLPEHFRRRHPRADLLQLLRSDATDAVFAARLLDSPHHHPSDECGDLLHSFGRRILPRDRRRRFEAVLDRLRPEPPGDGGRAVEG